MRRNNTLKRGFRLQRPRRSAERAVKVAALALCRWAACRGLGRAWCAAVLGLSQRTLRRWERGWRSDRMALRARGRPPRRLDRTWRMLVLEAVDRLGPFTSLAELRGEFPQAARRELAYILARCRRVHMKRGAAPVYVLHWTRPGSVWAADFTDAPGARVDGLYEELLAVRDAACGYQILTLPAPRADAALASQSLTGLFHACGAPLVVKTDNGSPFRAERTAGAIRDWGAFSLLSPPATPQYNGGAEASMGMLKTCAHLEAMRNDRAGRCSSDDIEAAHLCVNHTPRGGAPGSPTPQDLWDARTPITPSERLAFADAVVRCRAEVLSELGLPPDGPTDASGQAAVSRLSVSRALVARGYLTVTRRRISLPIKALFRAKIT